MAADLHARLRALPADYCERRGERFLLVWAELAQWLAVDCDAYELLTLLDGTRTLAAAVAILADRQQRPVAPLAREVTPLVRELQARGIVSEGAAAPVPADEVSLANITVNLTNRCNLSCPWCYNAGRQTAEMDVDRLIDNLVHSREVLAAEATLIVLGGEPLLAIAQLVHLLERAPEVFAPPVMFSTNGILLTNEVAARLRHLQVEVQVSLDGADAATHDRARGSGTYDAAVTGIARLVRAGVPTIMSMVYTRETMFEFDRYLALGRELEVNEVRFIPLRQVGGARDCARLLPDQAAALEHLLAVLAEHPEYRPLLARDYFSIMHAVCRHSLRRVNCGIGYRVAFVDADGTVYPCPNHVRQEDRCGSLREQTLAEIVRHAPGFSAARGQYRVSAYRHCRSCPFRQWCAGDCRGEVRAITGGIDAPSPHCAELRRIYPRLLWLLADDDRRLGRHDAWRNRLPLAGH